jgi:hypothetical protein
MDEFSFDHLDPTEFENLGYDLLRGLGFVNLDWRKGTGKRSSPADSGRDLEAQLEVVEIDKAKRLEQWFVDCKHYKEGVPPVALENLLAWANAEAPATALFMVSNFLSNPAKDFLKAYRENRRPPFRIKVWEKPILEELISGNEKLLRKYRLLLPQEESEEQEAGLRFAAFMQAWLELKLNYDAAIKTRAGTDDVEKLTLDEYVETVGLFKALNPYVMDDISELNGIRDRILREDMDPRKVLTDDLVNRARRLASEMERLLRAALPRGPLIRIGKVETDENYRFFEFRLENRGEGEVIAEAYATDLRDQTGKRIPQIDRQIRLHQRGFLMADKVQLSGRKHSYVAFLQVNNGDKPNTAHLLLATPSPTAGTYGVVPLLYDGPVPLDKQRKLRLSIRIDFLDDKGKLLRDTTCSFWIIPDETSPMRYRVRLSKPRKR